MPFGFGFSFQRSKSGLLTSTSAVHSLLFADGTDGLYLDFKKTDGRLYQNQYTGPLAATEGDSIARIMDSHSWAGRSYQQIIATQPELFTATGWDVGSGGSG
ncbi:MAG: hypothetical protein K0Q69_4066, partial [Devosia sp.]|nr:hypothetical protein [Devosia sp.]